MPTFDIGCAIYTYGMLFICTLQSRFPCSHPVEHDPFVTLNL